MPTHVLGKARFGLDPGRKPLIRVGFGALRGPCRLATVLVALAGIAVLAGCSDSSPPQEQSSAQPKTGQAPEQAPSPPSAPQETAQRPATPQTVPTPPAANQPGPAPQTTGEGIVAREQQARDAADNKAWADALRTGSHAAFAAYASNFPAGAHVAEARRRIAAIEAQTRKEADDKAWTEASTANTTAAFNAYLQKYGSGAHAADARRRIAAIEAQARKEADDKAWTEASTANTAAALNAYLQKFGSGVHATEARRRVAALEAQARKDAEALRKALAAIPVIDIKKTCRAASAVTGGGRSPQQDTDACLKSEEDARQLMAKHWAQFTANDRSRCVTPTSYLPSYVEWLTCLEMERDVRQLKQQPPPPLPSAPSPTSPRQRPALTPSPSRS